MKRIFPILLLVLSLGLRAQTTINEDEKYLPGYLVGAGNLYGGIGAQFQFQIKLEEKVHLTPFAALGVVPTDLSLGGQWYGFATGANLEYGKKHRVFGGLSYGTHGVGYKSKSSDRATVIYYDKGLIVGPSINIGYKGCTDFGLFWQLSTGASVVKNMRYDKNSSYITSFSIGAGYQF